MGFPLERYKFYVNQEKNKVYAVSTYCGKRVSGSAICAAEDEFDLEKGKRLAAARCNLKVAEKRMRRAETKVQLAEKAMDEIKLLYRKATNYFNDAGDNLIAAQREYEDIMSEF